MSKIHYPAFIQEDFPLDFLYQGKVRDVYQYSKDKLLIITTDRISAFDQVLNTTINGKGIVLTRLAYFWLNKVDSIVPTHLINCPKNRDEINSALAHLNLSDEVLSRSMLVNKVKPLPIEAVVRGYLIGSGYQEYKKSKTVCGIKLKEGLEEFAKLEEPIFTPATKASIGEHDINISFSQASDIVGINLINQVKRISLQIYNMAYEYALKRGIIIADTKFEFGLDENDNLVLIDEVLTPDSSRFYSYQDFEKSKHKQDFSKQIVRDYLLSNKNEKGNIPLNLPDKIVKKTINRYEKILSILTS